MFLAVHTAGGILISQYVKQPIGLFVVSFLSHYLIDIIPHGDEGIDRWIKKKPSRLLLVEAIDISLIIVFISLFLHNNPQANTMLLLVAVFGAVLPDFLAEGYYQITTRSAPFYRLFFFIRKSNLILAPLYQHKALHHRIHKTFNIEISTYAGLLLQLVFLVAFGILSM
ncbi:hypothetical protein KKG41_00960 [Patescibacteria group bacterium]|nr:hypothetical protein [Patescibacteria group bacterium]MBU1891075.1 hypothetical protein [Patescibacteria group bacterium]